MRAAFQNSKHHLIVNGKQYIYIYILFLEVQWLAVSTAASAAIERKPR